MSGAPTLATARLRLRPWRPADRDPFADLNADPEVMAHFPGTLARAESNALADRAQAALERQGWGPWAVGIHGGAPFIGFVGLSAVDEDFPFGPAVEVGWRLARPAWGHGYATEAARVALAFGFTEVGLPGIVSFTTTANARSQAVMVRLGMRRDPGEDFAHPRLSGHPLASHVLYRLTAAQWLAAQSRPA